MKSRSNRSSLFVKIALAILLLFTAQMPGQSYAALFQNGTTYPTTHIGGYDIISADFNKDGDLDLATVGYGSSLSIRLGNGDGTFGAQTTYNTQATYSIALASADFNGDGNLDLATMNRNNQSISILLGMGDGTFASGLVTPVGINVHSVAAADFNKDGKMDLAITTLGDNRVFILIGNGDGTFEPKVGYSAGGGLHQVATGDFDADGSPDLVVCSFSDGKVSVLLGNGDGTFAPKVDYSTEQYTTRVAVGDLNKDGRLDLVATSGTGATGYVSILLGNGDGTFQNHVSISTGGSDSRAILIGDFTGDGKMDILIGNWGSTFLSILRGNGDGTFNAAAKHPVGTDSILNLTSADYSGDGILDIAFVAQNYNNIQVLIGSRRNADLQGLGLSGGAALSPNFSAGRLDYTSTVPYSQSSVRVTPTASDAAAATVTVQVNGEGMPETVTSGTQSSALALDVGDNAIEVVVTAQDGTTIQTYTVEVTRGAPNTDAKLSGLSLSGGAALSPNFSAGRLDYISTVPYSQSSVRITPAASDAAAATVTVQVNGAGTPETVASGTQSSAVALDVGDNTIEVVVTAQDGTTIRTYTVEVTREPNTDASLSGLGLSGGAALSPAFSTGRLDYTSTVPYSQSSVRITPAASDAAAATVTVQVNGAGTPETVTSGTQSSVLALDVGDNTIEVVVTAQDGTTIKTYTVEVTREPNTDATLSGLGLSGGAALSPNFSAGRLDYTSTVPYSQNSIRVTPAADATATVTVQVNGAGTPETVASGTESSVLALDVGDNTIEVVVTAQDGTTIKTYTVEVTREPNTDASLSGLGLTGGATLSPAFSTGRLDYTANVPYSQSSIRVTPAADATATVTVQVNGAGTPETVASGTQSSALALDVGDNTIVVVVTAQDGTTTQTYTVEVRRAADTSYVVPPRSANADLSGLSLSEGAALSPAFMPEINSYTSKVAYNIDHIRIVPTLANEKASVQVKVNGGEPETVKSGSSGSSLPLNVGTNQIDVIVTAEDGTIRSYHIVLTRQEDSAVESQDPECPFTDIEGHWAKTAICEAYGLGIVEGVSATRFAADMTVTRAELAVMLLRTLQRTNREQTDVSVFNDQESIPPWAKAAIDTGVAAGILSGYPDGTFRPQQTIDRSEMAAMIAKAMKWEASGEQDPAFADDASIPGWARAYVYAVHENGMMQGRGGGMFVPKGHTTRAEAAVVLLRLWKTLH